MIMNINSRLISIAVIITALPLILLSCRDDSSTEIVGPVEDISYSGDIQPIFNDSCGGPGCHIGSSQSGVNLGSYDQVMNSNGGQYGRAIVEPEQPDTSPLVDKIEPSPEFGERMPFKRSPLSDRQIQEIRVWIEEGAMDN